MSRIPKEFLDEYTELSNKVKNLESYKEHLTKIIDELRTSDTNFERASKEWNSVTLMGRVQYSSRNVMYIEQRIVRFMIDMQGLESTYKPGDVVMIIGTIKTFRPDDPEDGDHWSEINVIPSKIVLVSARDDIELPQE